MLKIFNSLTKKKEEFRPLSGLDVKMYVCGPTVYNFIHIGNARTFVFFDLVRRYLQKLDYKVTYVQNFTDIDDKIIKAALAKGIPANELTKMYISRFFFDMDRLLVRRADFNPRVTKYISQIILAIQDLITKGYAYEVNGNVYFDVSCKNDYGKLISQPLKGLKKGVRVEVNSLKKHALDFALWKKAFKEEFAFKSPWGYGRPGWHIECSVMVREILGDSIDIHAGGLDLLFPHHENEIAQSEALTGKKFVKYWMHSGFVNIENEKMSKSKGNIKLVNNLLTSYTPYALRYFLLSSHYRSPILFSYKALDQAEKAINRINTSIFNIRHKLRNLDNKSFENEFVSKKLDEATKLFYEYMNDDFNTANAISVIFDVVNFANVIILENSIIKTSLERIYSWLLSFAGEFFGFVKEENYKDDLEVSEKGIVVEKKEMDAKNIEELISLREKARKEKKYDLADKIREDLLKKGIVVEDTRIGPRWYRK